MVVEVLFVLVVVVLTVTVVVGPLSVSVPAQLDRHGGAKGQSKSKPVPAVSTTVPSLYAVRATSTVQPAATKVPETWKPSPVACPPSVTPGRLSTVTSSAVPLCEMTNVSVSPGLEVTVESLPGVTLGGQATG